MNDVREMIISLRGEIPEECDFCNKKTPPNLLHPEKDQTWACIDCIEERHYAEICAGEL